MSWLNFAMGHLGEPVTSVEAHQQKDQVVSSYVWLPESGNHGVRVTQSGNIHLVEVWCLGRMLKLILTKAPTHAEIIAMMKLTWLEG